MIKVFFDSQIFLLQQRGGISRYFTELISAFAAQPELGIQPVLDLTKTSNFHLLESNLRMQLEKRRRWGDLMEFSLHHNRKALDVIQSCDIVHATYYSSQFLPKDIDLPLISTIHDFMPELLNLKGRFGNPHLAKNKYIKESDALVCVSQATLDDLRRLYPQSTAKQYVVPLAGNLGPGDLNGKVSKKEFVYIGNRSGYKRGHLLFQAFMEFTKTNPEYQLTYVGGGEFSSSELREWNISALPKNVRQLNLPDKDLADLISTCQAVVVPSDYEGFGLPILEAQNQGCLVIASSIKSSLEVSGSAALFLSQEIFLASFNP